MRGIFFFFFFCLIFNFFGIQFVIMLCQQISVFGSILNRNFGRNRKMKWYRNRNRNAYRNRNLGRNRNQNFPITNLDRYYTWSGLWFAVKPFLSCNLSWKIIVRGFGQSEIKSYSATNLCSSLMLCQRIPISIITRWNNFILCTC